MEEELEQPLELDWIQLHHEVNAMHPMESFQEKIKRKTLENPFIPIGCLATVAALTYGLRCFHKGDSKNSQLMMRARILAQGFTLMAFVIGLGLSAGKASKN